MNIYRIDAGEQKSPAFSEDGYTAYDYFDAVAYVAAETRNQAWAQFVLYFNGKEIRAEIPWWCKRSIKLAFKNLPIAAGLDSAQEWMRQHDPCCVELE